MLEYCKHRNELFDSVESGNFLLLCNGRDVSNCGYKEMRDTCLQIHNTLVNTLDRLLCRVKSLLVFHMLPAHCNLSKFNSFIDTFDIQVTLNRDKFLIIKLTRCTNFSNLFLEWNSTCFGKFLCPSSGVFHCTHSNGICHTGLLTASYNADRFL